MNEGQTYYLNEVRSILMILACFVLILLPKHESVLKEVSIVHLSCVARKPV